MTLSKRQGSDIPDLALMVMMRSKSSSVTSKMLLDSPRWQQLSRAASSLSKRCTTFLAHASTSGSLVASATMVSRRDSMGEPVGMAALRTGTAASRAPWSMSMRATLQPSMSRRPADSTPTLPPPPVIMTTLPSRRWMGSGRVRLVDVGARSMPGRGGLFRLRVAMLAPGVRRLSVVFARCMVAVVVVKSAVEVVMVGRGSCAVQRLLREDVARAGLAGTGPFCYFYVPSSPPHRTLLFPQDDVSPGFPRRNFFCVDQTPDAHPLRLLLAAVPTAPKFSANVAPRRHLAAPPAPTLVQ
ncbi:NAD(P)-binding protein [Alternaria alternata]|nr:NAD(P)-binding protein [Alternaria alternata]